MQREVPASMKMRRRKSWKPVLEFRLWAHSGRISTRDGAELIRGSMPANGSFPRFLSRKPPVRSRPASGVATDLAQRPSRLKAIRAQRRGLSLTCEKRLRCC